jgi:hypothetical protein
MDWTSGVQEHKRPIRCRLDVFLAVVVCSRQWNNAKEQRAQRPSWCYGVVSVVGVYLPAR